jgi:hypothetical protein
MLELLQGETASQWGDRRHLDWPAKPNSQVSDTLSPDGVLTQKVDRAGMLQIVESATGQAVCEFDFGETSILHWLPDGRRLLTRSQFGETTVWDLASTAAPRRADETASAHFQRLWPDFVGQDAKRAYAAVWAFVFAKDEATTYLRTKLIDGLPEDDEIRRLIRQLDDDDSRRREDAQRELIAIGPRVVPLLDEPLRRGGSVELRARAAQIKKSVDDAVQWRAQRRAAFALRRINTAASRELLERIESRDP